MQKFRVLALATGFDRFTVQDLTAVTGAPENTVRDAVSDLLKRESVTLSGRRVSKLLGRPAKEYAWLEGERERWKANLQKQLPLSPPEHVATSGEGVSANDHQTNLETVDPFCASLELATDLVVALENGATGEEALQLSSRAKSELRVLHRWVSSRADDDVSAVAGLSLRLGQVEIDPTAEHMRSELVSFQAGLLRKVPGIVESRATEERGHDDLEQGFGILINVARESNRASGVIESTFHELSRTCFTMNFPGEKGRITSMLEELSTFLLTPLSVMARVYIVTDGSRHSIDRASQLLRWFGQVSNLKNPAEQADDEATSAVLFYSASRARSQDWLIQGVHKQAAMRRAIDIGVRHPSGSIESAAAKLMLNDPLVICWNTKDSDLVHKHFSQLTSRYTGDERVVRGLVMGSFQTGAKSNRSAKQYRELSPSVLDEHRSGETWTSPLSEFSGVSNKPGIVRGIVVRGTERLEAETVRSLINLHVGDNYDRRQCDAALATLHASGLFATATIQDDKGLITVEVRENPIINRIVFAGPDDVNVHEVCRNISMTPRQIFSDNRVNADLRRITEFYQRSGKTAITAESNTIHLDYNRVDVVFTLIDQNRPESGTIETICELPTAVNYIEHGLGKEHSSDEFQAPSEMSYGFYTKGGKRFERLQTQVDSEFDFLPAILAPEESASEGRQSAYICFNDGYEEHSSHREVVETHSHKRGAVFVVRDAVRLSENELRVLRLLARGDSNNQIARELAVHEATVRVHVRVILRKLGVANRTQAAISAVSRGLVESPLTQVVSYT